MWKKYRERFREVSGQLILARDLKYIQLDAFEKAAVELTEIKRMLNAFIQKLRAGSE